MIISTDDFASPVMQWASPPMLWHVRQTVVGKFCVALASANVAFMVICQHELPVNRMKVVWAISMTVLCIGFTCWRLPVYVTCAARLKSMCFQDQNACWLVIYAELNSFVFRLLLHSVHLVYTFRI